MSSVSGSISIDTTKLERQIKDMVRTEVTSALGSAGCVPLETRDALNVLLGNVSAGSVTVLGLDKVERVIRDLLSSLEAYGYALVPVAGEALEVWTAERQRRQVQRADARLAEANAAGGDWDAVPDGITSIRSTPDAYETTHDRQGPGIGPGAGMNQDVVQVSAIVAEVRGEGT